jgi:hypothetical protein
MSRDWLAVYTNVIRRPKYRRLRIPARAALFHIWILAGQQHPEATWDEPADLISELELDGWENEDNDRGLQAPECATGVIDDLIASGWLDVDDAGRLLVHDWDDHQLAATNAARRAYERDRKRDWRRAKEEPPNPLPPAPSSPDITSQGAPQRQHNTGVPKRPGRVRDRGVLTSLGATFEGALCKVCNRPTSVCSCSERVSA